MNGFVSPSKDTLNYIKNFHYRSTVKNINLTSIIILTYNKLEYTKLCIESIRKFTTSGTYEIIVVDNKSSDETKSWLIKQLDIKAIYNTQNVGFPIGCNQGIEIATGDNILLLNNDVIVTPNWLENLNTALCSDEKIGAVGAITNSCSNAQQIAVTYNNIDELINFSSMLNKSNSSNWEYRLKLVGFCYLIKKEVLTSIGLLDPLFTPGNYEDDDLSIRIIKAGYNLLLCKDTFIHHFGSVSFSTNSNIYNDTLYKNKLKLTAKWGLNTSEYCYGKDYLTKMIHADRNAHLRVLELGCGLGATLLDIKSKFKNSTVFGLEENEILFNISKDILNVTLSNFESLSLDYKENYFDYIILGSELSNFKNPSNILNLLNKYLKPLGRIIAEIPNLNYINTVKNILNGYRTYNHSTPLNVNNSRFFTLNEITLLFECTGYTLTEVNKISDFISSEDNQLIDKLCNLTNKNMHEEYSTQLYTICAEKKMSISRYSENKLIRFKYMLIRLDNNLELANNNEALNYIFSIYSTDEPYFICDLKYFINNSIINKTLVLNKIINEAISRRHTTLAKILSEEL